MLPIGAAGQFFLTSGGFADAGAGPVERPATEEIRTQPVEPIWAATRRARRRFGPEIAPGAQRRPGGAGQESRAARRAHGSAVSRVATPASATHTPAPRPAQPPRAAPSLPFLTQLFAQDGDGAGVARIGPAPVGHRPVDAYQRVIDRERFPIYAGGPQPLAA